MAVRYCGSVKIRIVLGDDDVYTAHLSESGEKLARVRVNHPRYLTCAIDSPEAFDSTARAALAFAPGSALHGTGLDFDDSGYVVTRKRPERPNWNWRDE